MNTRAVLLPAQARLLLMLLSLCMVAWSSGLQAKGHGAGADAHHEKMARMLELDAGQKARFDALHQRMHPQMMALKGMRMSLKQRIKNLDPTATGYAGELEKLADESAQLARQKVLLRGQMQQEMATLLRSEQVQKWQKMRQMKHAKHAQAKAAAAGQQCAKSTAEESSESAKPGQRFFYK